MSLNINQIDDKEHFLEFSDHQVSYAKIKRKDSLVESSSTSGKTLLKSLMEVIKPVGTEEDVFIFGAESIFVALFECFWWQGLWYKEQNRHFLIDWFYTFQKLSIDTAMLMGDIITVVIE